MSKKKAPKKKVVFEHKHETNQAESVIDSLKRHLELQDRMLSAALRPLFKLGAKVLTGERGSGSFNSGIVVGIIYRFDGFHYDVQHSLDGNAAEYPQSEVFPRGDEPALAVAGESEIIEGLCLPEQAQDMKLGIAG